MKALWNFSNFLSALLLCGCLEPQPPSDDQTLDFGPESSPNDILTERAKALGTISPMQINVGQYLYFRIEQQILTSDPTLVGEIEQTVTAKSGEADGVNLSVSELTRLIENGQWTQQEDLATYKCYFDSPLCARLQKSAGKIFTKISPTALFEVTPMATARQTYHNLTVTTSATPAPDKVKQQPDCLGIPDCRLKTVEIRFDQISWESPVKKRKHLWIISPDVPYLGVMTTICVTGQLHSNGGYNPVLTQCSTLENFRF